MFKITHVLLVSLLLHACAKPENVVLEARSGDLLVQATIELRTSVVREGFVRISGSSIIRNSSQEVREYSNEWLWLSVGNDYRARAYLGNLTSHRIDEGAIDVAANETFEIPTYWVFPDSLTDPIEVESMSLELIVSD